MDYSHFIRVRKDFDYLACAAQVEDIRTLLMRAGRRGMESPVSRDTP